MKTNPLIQQFLDRIDRLELRFKGMKFADSWLIPVDELKAVRDELAQPSLPMNHETKNQTSGADRS